MIRNLIINFSSLLGIIFPRIFLIQKEYKESRLTIYNLHSTPKKYFPIYRSIIKKIDKKERFLNPKNIDKFFNKDYGDESFSLLTLDDGFNDNYMFAKEVLDPLNIKAIFFIIPKFLISKDRFKSITFFKALYPNYDPKFITNLKSQFLPLSKEKILRIQKDGHIIGMHGLNHENFSELSEKEIKNKIRNGLNIFKKSNIEINHFAYPFGDKKSFTDNSNRIIKKYFKYIHLGVRGSNKFNKKEDHRLLNRHPISSHKKNLIYFPISLREINFFTSNRISLLLNLTKRN